MSKLAFAGHDGAIYLSDVDGGERQAVSPPGLSCNWPAWSPDGRFVAFSGYRSGANGNARLAAYLKELNDEPARAIYANERGSDAIARRVPHYFLWSPDSRKLLVVAQTLNAGLSLFLYERGVSATAERLLDGGPLYTSWSRDSRLVLAHSFRSHYMIDTRSRRETRQMPGSASLYMAPSWSPTSDRFAVFRDVDREQQSLVIADVRSGRAQGLTTVVGGAGFSWSPDGSSIALLRDLDQRTGYYDGIWLYDAEGGEGRQITDERALCFFWSPNGGRLAFITPPERGDGSVRWAVIDVETETTRYLEHFRPSQEQLTTFMFFDQYSQSHSPWSPDGVYLVFSGALGYQAMRAPLPEGPLVSVFRADSSGEEPPQQVARGTVGFVSRV
ncbi:MAG: hypothetical protein L0177_15310 [Chloroflexi bacterium]|nr:hypothetical protein [Chloroflexota bacterium]